jgi:formylglycine-generating enzyme required for sulfatase activity
MPVICVSFWDAARFVNWLSTRNTETGVYNLGGIVNPTDSSSITRDQAAWEAGGWAIASENEWYKAAYYDPNKDGNGVGGYWTYPTQSDSISTDDANYSNYSGNASDLKNVGSYKDAPSYFGTYDQGGNVWEWTDSTEGNNRVPRGGSFYYDVASYLSAASGRSVDDPTREAMAIGFRVVSLSLTVVPEPGTWAGVAGLAMLVFGVWVRRGRRTL